MKQEELKNKAWSTQIQLKSRPVLTFHRLGADPYIQVLGMQIDLLDT